MLDGSRESPGEIVVLDVRTPSEYEREHLEGAVNLDNNAGIFRERASRLDRDQTYLVYCQSGTRSAHAADVMVELGFSSVYNMKGGITRWKGAGFPVVRGM